MSTALCLGTCAPELTGTLGSAVVNPVDGGSEVALLDGVTAASSVSFFAWLVRHLTSELGVTRALVGEVTGEDWERVRVLALAKEGTVHEGMEFERGASPFAGARDRVWVGPETAGSERGDALLQGLGAQGFAGLVLRDSLGRSLGVLAVAHREPLADPEAALSALSRFAPRVLSDLEKARAILDLEVVAGLGPSGPPGEYLLRASRDLARVFRVRVAFLAERAGPDERRARVAAMWKDGAPVEPFEYLLEGTPCALVMEREACFFPQGVADSFPDDGMLRVMGAQAYVGVVLRDDERRPVGLVGLIHDEPLPAAVATHPLLSLFAAHLGAELGRRRAEAERRALERGLFNSQKLEGLGVLAGNIAHDFNNILMGILGNVSLALMDSPEASPVRPHLRGIETAAHRAADLVRQMLAYSGRGRFVVAPVDLDAVVDELTQLLRASVPRSVTLDVQPARGLPRARADVTQLRQVIMNLVLNAAESHCGEHGTVRVTTGLVYVDRALLSQSVVGAGAQEGDYVSVTVEDHGVGMDADTLARIFDPFFTTKHSGRGLGLAAVAGIVRGHRGVLRVTSAPGRGSTFQLLLPALGDPSLHPELLGPQGTAVRRFQGVALVIDDESTVRSTLSEMLAKLGFRVLLASDGPEGVALYRARRAEVDVVLLDRTMPNLGGEEGLAELRTCEPGVRVVLMTGYDPEEPSAPCGQAGFAGAVQKPFDLDQLRAVLDAALPGGRSAPSRPSGPAER